MNIGWTLGEEILFKRKIMGSAEQVPNLKEHDCLAITDAGVLSLDRKVLRAIKQRF